MEETLSLSDWFLPSLYQQAADPVVFRAGARRRGEKDAPRADRPRAPGGLPGEPPYGFHGRARDLLQLERALATRAVVLLHGFGGTGKTALAAEAGRWFFRTRRFPGGAAFVPSRGGGSLSQLCSWVGQAVSDDPNWTLGEGDPVERVGALLRERPRADHPGQLRVGRGRPSVMPAEELRDVLDAVWAWTAPARAARSPAAPAARVLITTRDANLKDERFLPSRHCAHLGLAGLAKADALDLAAALFEAHGIDRARLTGRRWRR